MDTEKVDLDNIDWQSVLPKFGIPSECLSSKNKHFECPVCRDGKKRFRYDNKFGRGNFICSHCGSGDGIRLIALVNGVSDAEAIRMLRDEYGVNHVPVAATPFVVQALDSKEVERRKVLLVKVWNEASAVDERNAAGQYLNRRVPMLDLTKVSKNLRLHPRLKFYDSDQYKGSFPCLVAKVTSIDSQAVTLHRTYLSTDGYKAPFADVKKMMSPTKVLDGETVVLSRPTVQSDVLILCEGIETGLALLVGTQYRHHVWSALTANNLSKVKVPKHFRKVIIAADRDRFISKLGYRTGEHYAEILQSRLQAQGFDVVLRVPKTEKVDYCDLWVAKVNSMHEKGFEKGIAMASLATA